MSTHIMFSRRNKKNSDTFLMKKGAYLELWSISVSGQWRNISDCTDEQYLRYMSGHILFTIDHVFWVDVLQITSCFHDLTSHLISIHTIPVHFEVSSQVVSPSDLDHEVRGLNPAGSITQLMTRTVWHFIAWSLSLSPFHHLNMT